jgi:cell division protein FtsB
MTNQTQEKFKMNPPFPIVSLESGGMIGVTTPMNYPTKNAVQPIQPKNLTVSCSCLGLGAILGAAGAWMLVSGEISKVQATAKIQVSKAQDAAAIAQWHRQEQQVKIDKFCRENGGKVNGQN